MFSFVNVYLYHLKFCVVCIDGRRYVCIECNVSNECNEPTSCLVQPIGTHGGEVMYFGFMNCDDICICMCVESLSSSSLFLIPFMLTRSMMRLLSLLLLGQCPCFVSVVMWSSLVCG